MFNFLLSYYILIISILIINNNKLEFIEYTISMKLLITQKFKN